ncbi:MAG: DMT family transporter [Clostridiales bacterium]|nr:DMT family transporter [Clostridiales bacterium]
MKQKNLNLIAKLALLAATLIWGSSFILVKDVVDTLPTCALLAIRFLSASVILSLVFTSRFKGFNKKYLLYGGITGVLLYTAYMLQTFGITDTTPGKNAFLTAVYCVMVPFMAWLFNKKRPDKYNIIAALVCIVGIGMVSLTADFSIRIGDILTLCGGVFFALHIIAVSKFSDNCDPVLLTIFQFASSGICALICTLIFERGKITTVEISTELVMSVAYLAVCCTAIALLFQNFGQKYTDPSTASLLLSLESVFGVAFSVAFGREEMSVKLVIGFALIFVAVVISETKLSFLFKKQADNK